MAYKDKEVKKQKSREWYLNKRKNNPEFKTWKKEYDKQYHKEYRNPNLTPELSRKYQKKYKETHREEVLKKDREYKKRNYSKYKEQSKKYRENNKDKIKAYAEKYKKSGQTELSRIKHRYGLSKNDYQNLLLKQNNKCPLCGDSFDIRKKYIDHCHESKKVRGIVHRECNLMLGFAKDDVKILENAIKYLKEKKNDNQETTIIKPSQEGIG